LDWIVTLLAWMAHMLLAKVLLVYVFYNIENKKKTYPQKMRSSRPPRPPEAPRWRWTGTALRRLQVHQLRELPLGRHVGMPTWASGDHGRSGSGGSPAKHAL